MKLGNTSLRPPRGSIFIWQQLGVAVKGPETTLRSHYTFLTPLRAFKLKAVWKVLTARHTGRYSKLTVYHI